MHRISLINAHRTGSKYCEKEIGKTLRNAPINLKLTFQYVNLTDVRLGFFIEGVQYYDEIIEGLAEKLAPTALVYGGSVPITVKSSSIPIILSQIDFAEFGLTERWEYTLGLKK